jgi:hypothetical protein
VNGVPDMVGAEALPRRKASVVPVELVILANRMSAASFNLTDGLVISAGESCSVRDAPP